MTKLIAADMDGTLLDENTRVPGGTFELILALREAGVRFVASSGRRYDTLSGLFAPIADKMDFVASNGAQVVVGGELVDREVFSHAAIRHLSHIVALFDNLHLALFDRTQSFILDDESCYGREADKDLPNLVQVATVPPADVSILKVSVYCDDALMDMAYILTRELEADFVFAPSGRQWIDVMQRGVNKATGLAQVLYTHGIKPEEVMAFGDSLNDYEILRMAGKSRAMGNARSAIKAISDEVIGTNAEHAVQKELQRLLDRMHAAR